MTLAHMAAIYNQLIICAVPQRPFPGCWTVNVTLSQWLSTYQVSQTSADSSTADHCLHVYSSLS